MKTIALALLAALPSQQFDLDCSGQVADVSPIWNQANVQFRFDLPAGKWCEGRCEAVRDIPEVQPTVIWLDKSSAEENLLNYIHYRQIDRENGKYTFVSRTGYMEQAICVRHPFSGFPAFKTKF